MSKPSASGRRRNSGVGYHRHKLGGGNALKAVTRAARRMPSSIGAGCSWVRSEKLRLVARQLTQLSEQMQHGERAA